METFPAFYPLKGLRIVIAGDGEGAAAKARLFEFSPAEVTRIAPADALDPARYRGAGLIFIASYDADFVRRAAEAARLAGAPMNVVDHPELSDFHTPAIIDRGQVVAAIGTAGTAPLLASLLRAEIEMRVAPGAGRVAAMLGARRDPLRATFPDLPQRRAFVRRVLAGPAAAAADQGDMALALERLDEAIAGGGAAAGRVSIIQTPSSPDLISVRAVRVLNTVDVLASGDDAAAIVAAHARRDAEHWTIQDAGVTFLGDQAAAGRLVAVVTGSRTDDLEAALRARGVVVERLAPAPAV